MRPLFTKYFGPAAVAITLLSVGVMVILGWILEYEPKTQVDVTFYTTTPLFLLGLFQLWRTHRIQQAANIKDFLAEFRRDPNLYGAYFELIYSYDNALFEKVDSLAKAKLSELKRCETSNPAICLTADFSFIAELQGSRSEGARVFYPHFFAFSPEERRIDTLFDYFNTLGFYQQEGLIDIRDLARILGDYLAVFIDRKIVTCYLEFCGDPNKWRYDESSGATEPYPYLCILFDEFRRFNATEGQKREIRKLKAKIQRLKHTH
jgi:hypothetical protein